MRDCGEREEEEQWEEKGRHGVVWPSGQGKAIMEIHRSKLFYFSN